MSKEKKEQLSVQLFFSNVVGFRLTSNDNVSWKEMHSYIVQLFGVGQSQSHVHSISGACKFERAGMLTVTSFIQGHFSCFGLLNFKRTNRDPPSTFKVIPVIWLVDILCQHKEKSMSDTTQVMLLNWYSILKYFEIKELCVGKLHVVLTKNYPFDLKTTFND